jgi:hypothetical protein
MVISHDICRYKPPNREYDVDEFALREGRKRLQDESDQRLGHVQSGHASIVDAPATVELKQQQAQPQSQQAAMSSTHAPLLSSAPLLPPAPSGNPLVDEIMKISQDYVHNKNFRHFGPQSDSNFAFKVQSGGENPAIIRAIQGLFEPPARVLRWLPDNLTLHVQLLRCCCTSASRPFRSCESGWARRSLSKYAFESNTRSFAVFDSAGFCFGVVGIFGDSHNASESSATCCK